MRPPERITPPETPASNGPELVDRQGRRITYLRLAITDRCNLRCRYCRPEEGVPFIPHEEILTLEELERLTVLFCSMGVIKVRVTGGEPFSRRGCITFLQRLRRIKGLTHLHVTTNGVKTARFLDELARVPIDGLNLSLDTLDPDRFFRITRRDYLDAVLQTLYGTLEKKIPLKVNSVMLEDTSDEEIMRLVVLARELPLTLRFIETMPFSGRARNEKLVNGDLAGRLRALLPDLREVEVDGPTTARLFSHPGFAGMVGVIQGHSRQFCTTCNKVRITPVGMLKTCLYDNGVLDLRALLRAGSGDAELREAVARCVRGRHADGHETELHSRRSEEPSMGLIGG
ncbi:MAG: GTP 3',8-cyclase MoaA [Desulfobulbaceae bacterium]